MILSHLFNILLENIVFYSLRNFLFDQSNPATHSSLMVEMDMIGNEAKIFVHPIILVSSIPQQMDNSSCKALLEKLKSQSSLNITIEDCRYLNISNMKQKISEEFY